MIFASPGPIQAAHIGAFWERVKSSFPKTQDAPPFPTVLEQIENSVAVFEWGELLPLRRTLLSNESGSNLIQIQQDRFLFNWKQTLDQDQYPSYSKIILDFENYLGLFLNFLDDIGVSRPSFRQYELTYINHITSSNGLNETNAGHLFVDHMRNESEQRFLAVPDSFNWRTSYLFPNDAGRLHVFAQNAVNELNKEKIVRLDMIARGFPLDGSEELRKSWFDMAHVWITHGFADVTAQSLQITDWKRTS